MDNKEKKKQTRKKIVRKARTTKRSPPQPPTPAGLYPELDDPTLPAVVAKKAEFDFHYDGKIDDIKKMSALFCAAEFQLAPHQLFLKNFMSFKTPYNSVLLFQGLGTGKTCSSIGIAEGMRSYFKKVGIDRRIYVVASPNVQANFQKELFDESQLVVGEDGYYTMKKSCTGNLLLRELFPSGFARGARRTDDIQTIGRKVQRLIRHHYKFMGYVEFANYIEHLQKSRAIERHFNDSLVIIDEIHNIRNVREKTDKEIAKKVEYLVRVANNMRMVLLSATPMYNHFSEIIWLVNLMRANDKRPQYKQSDIFQRDGNFTEADSAGETGEMKFRRFINGYVSYVRGENPYTFPYRLYPPAFASRKNYYGAGIGLKYPTKSVGGLTDLDDSLKYVPVYVNHIGEYQERAYDAILGRIGAEAATEAGADEMKYDMLQQAMQVLNITYPYQTDEEAAQMFGRAGLENCMEEFTVAGRRQFRYLRGVEHVFAPANLSKYSHKMSTITDIIARGTDGIILIYSDFIYGGLLPMALALESIGLRRVQSAGGGEMRDVSLLANPPAAAAARGNYIMITGNAGFSGNNARDIKMATSSRNLEGELVKVILISRSGAEGLDFQNIRQVHILDPWYNMSRIEQIIGRAVRNKSHCNLPFARRNVEIYLHATQLSRRTDEEAVDTYIYRIAENKAVAIGRVQRVMKSAAIDCLLNIEQQNFTADKIVAELKKKNATLDLVSSTGRKIKFAVGDKPYTYACDYMATCGYDCAAADAEEGERDVATYDEPFLAVNRERLVVLIKNLFKERAVYSGPEIVRHINFAARTPLDQIYATLSFMIRRAEPVIDPIGRRGYLINRGLYYAFQPAMITDENATILERRAPLYRFIESFDAPTAAAPAAAAAPSAEITQYYSENWRKFIEPLNLGNKKIINKTITKNDWFIIAQIVAPFAREMFGVDVERAVVEHMMDTYSDKLALLRAGGAGAPPEIRAHVTAYLESKRLVAGRELYVVDGVEGTEIIDMSAPAGAPPVNPETIEDILVPYLQFQVHTLFGFLKKSNTTGITQYTFKMKNKNKNANGNSKGQNCSTLSRKDFQQYFDMLPAGAGAAAARVLPNFSAGDMCVLFEIIMRGIRGGPAKTFLSPELVGLVGRLPEINI